MVVRAESLTDERLLLRLVVLDSSALFFRAEELAQLDCMLVNLSNKNFQLKFDKAQKDNSPINIHKLVADDEKGNGLYELKENSSLFLKVVFFPRSRGVFNFNFFKVLLVVNKTQTPIEYEAPDVFIT